MKKREEFSVSLRKQKKSELIMTKRKRKPQQDDSPLKEESANMRDDTASVVDAIQKEIEALMATIWTLIPPEYVDAEWNVKFSYLLNHLSVTPGEELTPESFLRKHAIIKFFRISMIEI